MAKRPKQGKKSPEQQDKQAKTPEKKVSLSSKFLDDFKDALVDFSKISESERVSLYWNQAFLDQFWEYYKKNQPEILDGIKKEDLPKYLAQLEKKWFSLSTLVQNTNSLHNEFAPEKPEREVMQESLRSFDTFCKEKVNNIPEGTFKKFADQAGFDHETYHIPRWSKLQTVDDLYLFWKSFAENEGIEIKPNQHKNIEDILCPEYNPVERIMVEVAITKLRKELPTALQDDFDERFVLPLTAFSALGNLRNFKQAWLSFLDDHASQIDKNLAKKLDSVRVTNGDIKRLFMTSGKKFDATKSYDNQTNYFLRVFNKLATRQLFEDAKEDAAIIEKYVDVIADTIKWFPPYVNEIFRSYPYDHALVLQSDPSLDTQVTAIEKQISEIELTIANDATSKEERARLRKKKSDLNQKKEELRRMAYTKYLATKDAALAAVMVKLVGARFDFAKLSLDDQQVILTFLVKDKLNSLISHQAAELLGIDADELTQFTNDLFDLHKKDLTIYVKGEPVHIIFKEKKFLSQQVDQLLSVKELAELKTLPLQFTVQPTPSSQAFFEEGILRWNNGGQLFDTFQSKNGPVILNDGYKVKLTKDGKEVTWYLSQYPPIDEEVTGEVTEEEKLKKSTRWYMYSQPVTEIHQNRERVTWDGNKQGTPVVVDEKDEHACGLEVVDRSFALNGEAIGSLIFAYVLGQQSMSSFVTKEKEKELAKHIGALDKFLDTQDHRPAIQSETVAEDIAAQEKNKEDPEQEKFMEEWKHLNGYTFSEKENFGFKKWTKLYINTWETALPPDTTWGATRMQLEIIDTIDKKKWTFTVKMHGGEFSLWWYEWKTKEMPINGSTIDKIKELLGKDIYKVPPPQGNTPADALDALKKSWFDTLYQEHFASTFDLISREDGKYKFKTGDFVGKDVVSFGQDINDYIFDAETDRTIPKPKSIRYQVKYLSNGKVSISHKFSGEGEKPRTWERDMDYANFILFVAGKKLEPQASDKDQKEKNLQVKNDSPDLEPQKKKTKFSINNIGSFFKTSVNKIKDGIKKYDEERAEELTDAVLQNGAALEKFGKFWGGLSSRIGEGMETAGLEYYTTRDSRIWKKIERWQKYYEQEAHYASFFHSHLKNVIKGDERPRDIYKIPAMLLTVITKEKDPYARNPQLIWKGQWVNLILGKANQERYLTILNNKKKEMRQNAAINGINWTTMKNEEIVKLEMQYIISVIDGREHTIQDKWVYEKAMADKWSRGFANKLSDAAKTVGFWETDKKANDIPMSTTFEFAEFEYSRNVKTNKSASALPNLKAMAKLAQTERQWEVFQMHIVSWVLSGYFWRTLDAQSKWWIKDICRTRWFIPWLWAKDIYQQNKMQKLLDIYSHGKFSKEAEFSGNKNFSVDDYTFGNMDKFGVFVHDDFKKRWLNKNNGHKFCQFLEMTGGNVDDKKLMDLAQDPNVPNDERVILKEYMMMWEQTSEDIDKDVKNNPSALKWSPFTKCETIVTEMMKYNGPVFDGATSSEKAGPAEFWKNVAKWLPTSKDQSSASREFFMRKFMNRFGRCGFEWWQQPTIFLKRLVTIQEMYKIGKSREADDMLWYTINGTIIQGNTSGKENPPKEFTDAVDVFRQFFKNNLDYVLSPTMITNTLGERYARDSEAKKPYKIWSREEYVKIVKPKWISQVWLSKDETTENRKIKQMYQSNVHYEIYKDLDRLADSLEDRHGIRNAFKKYGTEWNSNDDTLSPQPPKATARNIRNARGISVTNPQQTKEELKNTLWNQIIDTSHTTRDAVADDLEEDEEDFMGRYNY